MAEGPLGAQGEHVVGLRSGCDPSTAWTQSWMLPRSFTIDPGLPARTYLDQLAAHHGTGVLGGLTTSVGAFLLVPGLVALLSLVGARPRGAPRHHRVAGGRRAADHRQRRERVPPGVPQRAELLPAEAPDLVRAHIEGFYAEARVG